MARKENMKKILWVVLISLAIVWIKADTVTDSRTTIGVPDKITLTWTAAVGGVRATLTNYIRGEIVRVEYKPDAVSVPLDGYDLVLTNSIGFDVLGGTGTNLSSTIIKSVVPAIAVTNASGISGVSPCYVNDLLTLVVTNCGATNAGQVILYVK